MHHLPLSVQITCDCIPLYDSNFVKKTRTIHKWHLANEEDKHNYYNCTHGLLSDIEIPIKALCCKDSNCTDHIIEIESFYNQILSAIKLATCHRNAFQLQKALLSLKLFQGGTSMLKSIMILQEMRSTGGPLTIDHVMDQFITP